MLRMVLFAYKDIELNVYKEINEEELTKNLIFVGLVGIKD